MLVNFQIKSSWVLEEYFAESSHYIMVGDASVSVDPLLFVVKVVVFNHDFPPVNIHFLGQIGDLLLELVNFGFNYVFELGFSRLPVVKFVLKVRVDSWLEFIRASHVRHYYKFEVSELLVRNHTTLNNVAKLLLGSQSIEDRLF